MFTNIIFFILALLIYQTRSLGPKLPLFDLWVNSGTIFFFLIFFGLETKRQFHRLTLRAQDSREGSHFLQLRHQQITHYLMILSLIFFAAENYLLNFKSLVLLIPGVSRFSSLEGALGISLYLFHLVLIWYLGFESYKEIFHSTQTRTDYLRSQLQFNLPILFPWLAITFFSDLIDLVAGPESSAFLNQPFGEMLYILIFLAVLSVFFPFLVKTWWGCRPVPEGPKHKALSDFCQTMGAPFRQIFLWPAFGGKLLTAGVMGLVKRFRYLLITPALLDLLDEEELVGVVAHEIGHVRKKHLFFYLFFFCGYVVLAIFFSQWISLQLLKYPGLLDLFSSWKTYSDTLYSALLILPLALGLVLYFRFLFGFFMRNFERQADLYALEVLGSPWPLIRSLEKISHFSGQSRNLPSWHHFSIAQRVDFLEQVHQFPRLDRRHQKKISWSVGLFFILLIGLGLYGLQERIWFSTGFTEDPRVLESLLTKELRDRPEDPKILMALATLYQQREKYGPAQDLYEKILKKNPQNVLALNNLAWLLATSSDPAFFQPQKALILARKAAALKPEPMILDTLAEAFWVNGRSDLALEITRQVLAGNPPNRPYYQAQEKRFKGARKRSEPPVRRRDSRLGHNTGGFGGIQHT
jgi:Zn-dependent protease with chaperone function